MPSVLVTGGNRGIGLEFARAYAASGWRVIACVRRPAKAAALNKLATASDLVEIEALDVTDHKAIDALAKRRRGQAIDLLINNAGVYGPDAQDIRRIDFAGWAAAFAVNAMAPIKMARAFLDHVARSERKTIANITSQMGSIGDNSSGGAYAYRASKAALNMAAKSLSVDCRSKNIVVVVLHPGWVRTDMGGSGAPLTPKASVAGLRQVIDGLTLADSGKFFDYRGAELPW
jgi:NAD(P)-dependent dehydrogenase (short-subunit alcohol dehydrogenase family)